jgi:hypothetical protein
MSRTIRTYIAGSGATAALIAAALVGFLTVAAYVSVNGMPGALAGSDEDSVFLGGGSAPAVAAALSSAPGAVAGTPAPFAPGLAPAGGAAGAGPGGGPGGGVLGTQISGTPSGIPGTTLPAGGTPSPTQQGMVGDTVNGANNTLQGTTNQNTGLGGTTAPITGPVDNTVNGVTGPLGGLTGNGN